MLALSVLVVSGTFSRPEHKIGKKNVPVAVLKAFEKTYPKATARGYAKETENGRTEFEIESREGSIARDVSFDGTGSIISVEETLPAADLPEPVHAALMKDYPKAKILKCEKVTENGATNFEIRIASGKRRMEAVYTAEGAAVDRGKK